MKRILQALHVSKYVRLFFALASVSFVFAVILIAVMAPSVRYAFIALLIFTVLYLPAIYVAYMFSGKPGIHKSQLMIASNCGPDLFRMMQTPIIICDEEDRIVWMNEAADSLHENTRSFFKKNISTLCGVNAQILLEAENSLSKGYITTVSGVPYCVHAYRFRSQNQRTKATESFLYTIWENRERQYQDAKKLEDADTLVACIVADNLDDVMQSTQKQYILARIDELLQKWAESCDGILKEYEKGKYLLLFSASHLATFKENRFDILDKIRESKNAETGNFPLTISAGISVNGGSLAEKERAAHEALDIALQRGGDQVVIKDRDTLSYIGGKSNGIQRRTKVHARVKANELKNLILNYRKVLIMGHRAPDFDSFGSCVGLAKLCMTLGLQVHIVVDPNAPALPKAFEMIFTLPEYRNLFLSGDEALDLVDSETLLIVSDVNVPEQFESKTLFERISAVAVIDHHRISDELPKLKTPLFSYIEPSASSACELVSEFLGFLLPSGSLGKVEAELMLAGILLDTKRFSHNTGVRTFSAAQYLRDAGADPLVARQMFRFGLDEFIRESVFSSNVYLYCGKIAIAVNNGADNTGLDRVVASRTADELLMVEGVEASFALCRIGNVVHISGRSNGKLNVHTILERLHGGGHFDASGAQLCDTDMGKALSLLKESIDRYLESLASDSKA